MEDSLPSGQHSYSAPRPGRAGEELVRSEQLAGKGCSERDVGGVVGSDVGTQLVRAADQPQRGGPAAAGSPGTARIAVYAPPSSLS